MQTCLCQLHSAVLIFAAFWLFPRWNDLNTLIQKRTEFEASLKPEAPLPLESVLTGMQDFLDQGFQILDRHRNHRPVIFVQMTNIVFESLERLFSASREYQEEKSDRRYSFPEDVENTFSVDINDSEMLTLTVKKGVFAGETVIFGMLVVEREAYFSKEMVLRPELLRIGGTLPDRYRARSSVLHVGANWVVYGIWI